MMLTPLQRPFVHSYPPCDGASTSARDSEEREDNTKREFGQRSLGKEDWA